MSSPARPGPVAWAALRALRGYKLLVSPLFAGSCRYLPSCSDYTAEAIARHGAAAGIGLGVHRLCRCHPFGGSGYDPVPESNPWRAMSASRERGAGPRS
jgi:putative membrane protein insertion efficiency factor